MGMATMLVVALSAEPIDSEFGWYREDLNQAFVPIWDEGLFDPRCDALAECAAPKHVK